MPNNGEDGPHYDCISVDFIKGTAFVVPKVGCSALGAEHVFYVNKFML
jgi:hypothetical protein